MIATAHIGLAVFGIGKCWYQGALLPAKEALERAGIELRTPGPREGHALVSGTYEITALGCLAVETFQALLPVADAAGAMSLEALKGNTRGYDARLHALRPFHGQQETARILRSLLTDSEILHKYRDFRVQDALSLRCIPQIHGAVRDQLAHCRQMVTTELNSVTDNPVFLLEQDELVVLPGGNGHGAPLALSLDALAIAVAQLSTASQARSDRLTNSHLSGLPAFLIAQGGANSGMMIRLTSPRPWPAITALWRRRPACTRCPPAPARRITSAWGERGAQGAGGIENAVDILAIELLCATQALEFHRPLRASRGSETVLAAVRRQVPFRQQDREMAPDMRAVRDLISGGELLRRLTPIVYPVADKDA